MTDHERTVFQVGSLRRELAAALDVACPDVAVGLDFEQRIDTPCIVVMHGDPWISSGDQSAIGEVEVAVRLWFAAGIDGQEATLNVLENTVPVLVSVIRQEGWDLDSVGPPSSFSVQNIMTQGVEISVSRYVRDTGN